MAGFYLSRFQFDRARGIRILKTRIGIIQPSLWLEKHGADARFFMVLSF